MYRDSRVTERFKLYRLYLNTVLEIKITRDASNTNMISVVL